MDATAFTLCQESCLPITVFDLRTRGNVRRVLEGEALGTRVHWNDDDAPVEMVSGAASSDDSRAEAAARQA